MRGDNLRAYITDWELVLCSLKELPAKDIQESLFRRQLNKAESLKHMLALYDLGISQKGESKDYDSLISMCRTHLETKRREKVASDLRGRGSASPGPKAAAKAKAEDKAERPRSGDCRQWIKAGSCNRGDNCPWADDEAKKPLEPSLLDASPEAKEEKEKVNRLKSRGTGQGQTWNGTFRTKEQTTLQILPQRRMHKR